MHTGFTESEFYAMLGSALQSSTVEKRQKWAGIIIERDFDLKKLFPLLQSEKKTANRFLWLLTEIGTLNRQKLRSELPHLLDLCERDYAAYLASFATFWLTVGIPPENEGKAIGLLFEWLVSPKTTATIKWRAVLVLIGLTKKYPELKNELRICVRDRLEGYPHHFKKKLIRILIEMEK